MTNTNAVQNPAANRRNKFIAYLLLTAALVSATKDVSRVKDLAAWIGARLAPVYASNLPTDRSCPGARTHTADLRFEVRHIAFDQSGKTDAMLVNEPQVGGEIAMADFGKAHQHSVATVSNRRSEQRTSPSHLDQRAIENAIAARLANSAWPRTMEFKAVSRGFTLELPPLALTKEDRETPDAEAWPDTSAAPLSRPVRRHVVNVDRELNLKIQNAIIRARRAS